MGKSTNSPTAPDFSKQYKEGLQTYLKFLPTELQQELGYRGQYNPAFTQQALDLQHQFDPALAGEQLSALQRRDPQWLALHQGLGDRISQALSRGYVDPLQASAYAKLGLQAGQVDPRYQAMYSGMAGQAGKVDPRYNALYNQITGLAGKVDPRYQAAYSKLAGLAGQVDPRQEAAYNQWAQTAGKIDPTRLAEYKALGKQVTGDTLRGTKADPATLRQMTQAILSRQPNLSYGEAQDMASAVYVGQRGQALQQQRQGAGEQFLSQATPTSQQQQSLAQFYGAPSITQQRQQSLGQFSQVLDPTRMAQQSTNAAGQFIDPTRLSQQSYLGGLSALDPTRMSQASLGQFYGQNAPEMQAMGLAGTFIQPSNSVTQAINSIQGVTAPSAMQYVNPNAGYQGVQFGLQNYQNLLAQQNQSGGGNPWTNALSGAATGAQYGSIGGPYGAVGGGLVGAAAGAFGYPQYSDAALKQNVSRTGLQTPDGIPIVEYDYQGRRWRGVLAQEVYEVRPDAVYTFPGGTLGVFYDRINATLEEVQ